MDRTVKQRARLPSKVPLSLIFGLFPVSRIKRATRVGQIIAHTGRYVMDKASIINIPRPLNNPD
jgi:hypothetical protein